MKNEKEYIRINKAVNPNYYKITVQDKLTKKFEDFYLDLDDISRLKFDLNQRRRI